MLKAVEKDEKTTVDTDQAAFLSLVYRIFRENLELRTAYEKLLTQTTSALMQCVEEKDAYTYGHSIRVMEYTLLIARGAKLKESDLRNIELAAMFHDLGKMGIPDCVLLKADSLDFQEEKTIQAHPNKSAAIVSHIDAFKNVVDGIRHHHERMDGRGYPEKLKGKEIPLYSRIILVADTFDAMTSTRPYRKALPIETAYAELEKYSGSQFDPEFVEIFLNEHKKLTLHEHPEWLKKAA